MQDIPSKDEAIKHFYHRVDIICSMEVSRKITPKKAYELIKTEYKLLKLHIRKKRA